MQLGIRSGHQQQVGRPSDLMNFTVAFARATSALGLWQVPVLMQLATSNSLCGTLLLPSPFAPSLA